MNSCSAGEPVALTGVVHVSYSVSTDSSGVNHFVINANTDLTGAGQNTGLPYAASESEKTIQTTRMLADLTVEMKSDLKPVGTATGTSLTLVQTLHITVDTGGNIGAQVCEQYDQLRQLAVTESGRRFVGNSKGEQCVIVRNA